jgi:ADP-ribose pyrophosphatase YjhB (NUDIX family)
MSAIAVRLRASAAILRDGRILLIEGYSPAWGHFLALPGGGVRQGENLIDAVVREAHEETGLAVRVGSVLLIFEQHLSDAEAAEIVGANHNVGFVFRCIPLDDSEPVPAAPDTYQTGLRWVDVGELPDVHLVPPIGAAMRDAIVTGAAGSYTQTGTGDH